MIFCCYKITLFKCLHKYLWWGRRVEVFCFHLSVCCNYETERLNERYRERKWEIIMNDIFEWHTPTSVDQTMWQTDVHLNITHVVHVEARSENHLLAKTSGRTTFIKTHHYCSRREMFQNNIYSIYCPSYLTHVLPTDLFSASIMISCHSVRWRLNTHHLRVLVHITSWKCLLVVLLGDRIKEVTYSYTHFPRSTEKSHCKPSDFKFLSFTELRRAELPC